MPESNALASHIISKITDSVIDTDPFPHIIVSEILPSDFYQELLTIVSDNAKFVPAVYPGTGVNKGVDNSQNYGFAFPGFATHKRLQKLYGFLKSDVFCRILLDKFSSNDSGKNGMAAIPAFKHQLFTNGQRQFTSVFDIHKDVPGYEILPHRDIPEKLVTYQFFLQSDDSLSEFGTLLCKPKLTTTLEMLKKPGGPEGQYVRWHNWELFDIVKQAHALPNLFLCFAPNEHSFHAVRMNIPKDHDVQYRTVLRGFIRAGMDAKNFVTYGRIVQGIK